MRALRMGLGLHQQRKGGKKPVLSWDFSRMGTLPAELAVDRTGQAGMWQDDGSLGFGPHNLLLRSSELNVSPWDANSSGVLVTAGPETGEYLVEDNPGSGNSAWFLQTFSGAASTAFTLSCWLRVDSGTKSVLLWLFDDVSGGARSSAITVTTEWTRVSLTATPPAGATLFRAGLDNVPLGGVRVKRVQVNRGTVALDYVATTTAARYLMRFEKHPSTGRRGLVGEPQRTQEMRSSRTFGGTGWSVSGAPTITQNYANGLNGSQTASRLLTSAVSNGCYQFSLKTYAIGDRICVWATFKPLASTNSLKIGLDGAAVSGVSKNIVVSLSTLQVTSVPGEFGSNYGVVALPSGFYMVWGSLPATAAGTVGVTVYSFGGSGAIDVLIDDVQLEDGEFPTSAIVNTSTSATLMRAVDSRVVYSLPTALQTALASGGTMFCEFAFGVGGSAPLANNRHAISLGDGTTNNRVQLYNQLGNVGAFMRTAGVEQYSASNGLAAAEFATVRAAITFSAGRCRACVNGSLLSLASSVTLFTPTQLGIGCNWAGDATLGGVTYRAQAYTDVLTDAELQSLAHA